MRLGTLLKDVEHRPARGAWDGIDVSDIVCDSRRAHPGCLYVCIPGTVADGHAFAADAVRQGAAALLVTHELPLDVPQVIVGDARNALAATSAAFFGDGSARMSVVGVTGTAGKTTVTHMVEHIVSETGGRPGLIGTTGCRFAGRELPTAYTTPLARDLQDLLGQMADASCDVVTLEVSSHAIATRRCARTHFAVAAFTNPSREHLELHGTMEDYFATKAPLFTEGDVRTRVVCAMDEGGRRLAHLLRKDGQTFFEVSDGPDAHVRLQSYTPHGLDGALVEAEVDGMHIGMELKVPGNFNARNALVALGITDALGLNPRSSAHALEGFAGAPGRMERIREADARGLCGNAFPELWFEMPLTGDAWFDVHMLISRKSMHGNEAFAGLDGVYAEVLAWFARSEDTRQLALSFDSGSGDARHPAVQLLLDTDSMAATRGFLSAAGRSDLSDAYRSFVSRMPKDWYACYSGVFPARPDAGWVRVECIVGEKAQRAYTDDPESLGAHLAQVGVGDVDGEMLSHARELARSDFPLELQFDVGRDGHALPRLGASVRFQPHDCADAGALEHVERLLSKTEEWGLADGRWRRLRETAFCKSAKLGEEVATLWCFPAFLKVRWRDGDGLDAKAYLMAGAD